jgi:hypothetical protein
MYDVRHAHSAVYNLSAPVRSAVNAGGYAKGIVMHMQRKNPLISIASAESLER